MKKKVAKELRAFSEAKLGPVPTPPRRHWLRRAWDWLCGVARRTPSLSSLLRRVSHSVTDGRSPKAVERL